MCLRVAGGGWAGFFLCAVLLPKNLKRCAFDNRTSVHYIRRLRIQNNILQHYKSGTIRFAGRKPSGGERDRIIIGFGRKHKSGKFRIVAVSFRARRRYTDAYNNNNNNLYRNCPILYAIV